MAGGRQIGTPKTGGRKPGTKNKRTETVKDALEQAFSGIGGAKALAEWAADNQTEFYKLWGKLLPRDINVESTVGGKVVFVMSKKGRQ